MRTRRLIAGAGAVGLAMAAIGLVPVASASASTPSASRLLAGYEVTPVTAGSGGATDTFTVPSITCPSKSQFYGMGPGVLLLAKTTRAHTGAVVEALCLDTTTPIYFGTVVINGTNHQTSFSPAPGDRIVVSTSETASASRATLDDVTKKVSLTETGSGATIAESFDGITTLSTSPPTPLSVPTFKTVNFSAARLNGTDLEGATALNLVDSSKRVEISTGSLNVSHNAFTETFKANS